MTASSTPDDSSAPGISDDQLPEDLRPSDDNPLAVPLDPDDEATRSPDELGMDETQDVPVEVETDPEATADTGPGSAFDPEAPADTEPGAGATSDDEEAEDS